MNKYENAIDVVARYCSDYRTGIFPPRNNVYKELDILNELVEKATPKKVKQIKNHYFAGTYEYDYTSGYCPYCNKDINCNEYYQPNYCHECGQKLDWSNYERY